MKKEDNQKNRSHTLLCWLALTQVNQLSAYQLKAILKQNDNVCDYFKLARKDLLALGFKPNQIMQLLEPDWDEAEKSLRWLEQDAQHNILILTDDNYPMRLKAGWWSRQSRTPPSWGPTTGSASYAA